MERHTILYCCAHYNDTSEVIAFISHLNCLYIEENWEIRVAVADNSNNLRAESIHGINNVDIFIPSGNLGYLAGCKFALDRWVCKHNIKPDIVCITNTDIELCLNFINILVSQIYGKDVGIIAPNIIRDRDGLPQNPSITKRPSVFRIIAYGIVCRIAVLQDILVATQAKRLFLKSVVRRIYDWYRRDRLRESDGNEYIYAPHGSMIILRRQFFDLGGMINYEGFMFGEELYIGEQAYRLGIKIIYIKDLKVIHKEHISTSKISRSRVNQWKIESNICNIRQRQRR